MKPSDFSTSSTRPRKVDAGVETTLRRRICALRMRVSISPIGSLTLIVQKSFLPARLHETGNLPEIAEFTHRDAAELGLAIDAARTPRELAPVAVPARRGIARQLGQLE